MLLHHLRLTVCLVVCACITGCATAPTYKDQAAFLSEADATLQWFQNRVPGLREQISASGGYTVFPSVGQWGIIFGGGRFGRGLVADNRGTQIGWSAINTGSLGLQAGVRGFRVLLVFQDEATLERFRANRLTGSAGAVMLIAESGGSSTASFANGVAVYEGASTGLMGGLSFALDFVRFKPLTDPE